METHFLSGLGAWGPWQRSRQEKAEVPIAPEETQATPQEDAAWREGRRRSGFTLHWRTMHPPPSRSGPGSVLCPGVLARIHPQERGPSFSRKAEPARTLAPARESHVMPQPLLR